MLPVAVGDARRARGRAAAARRDGGPAGRRQRDRGDHDAPTARSSSDVAVTGPLGAQMLLWETATAVAGRILGINPFDQPDVESAKKAARGLLDGRPGQQPAGFTDGAVEVRALGGDCSAASTPAPDAVDGAARRRSTPTTATSP